MPDVAWSRRYAHGAEVQVSKSQSEIKAALNRFGCRKIIVAEDPPRAVIFFEHDQRRIRFTLPDPRSSLEPFGYGWTEKQLAAEERRLWRSLLMCIKAKLDMVQAGITDFETEFLPYMQLEDGRTFGHAAQDPGFVDRLTATVRAPFLELNR